MVTLQESPDPAQPGAARRPRLHFSAQSGWINDPNGLVRVGATWQLFFQHYPNGIQWGPMHWGHASSSDLLNWVPHPIALRPVGETTAFSGCAVLDEHGTAGLGEGALVALYTRHDDVAARAQRVDCQAQYLAYSLDGGEQWFDLHEGFARPVLPNPGDRRDFRDPKVLRDHGRDRWLMVLADGDRINFYASADLRRWKLLSHFGPGLGSAQGVWECPDLFWLPCEGTASGHWVLLVSVTRGGPNGGSAVQYFVGDFDGQHFNVDPAFAPAVQNGQGVWMDHGRDHYAFASWSGLPHGDVVGLAWMNNWLYAQKVPADGWRGAMTLPVRLSLRGTAAGPRLAAEPMATLAEARRHSVALHSGALPASLRLAGGRVDIDPRCFELELELAAPVDASVRFWVELGNRDGEVYCIGLDAEGWFSDRALAPRRAFDEQFSAGPARAPRIFSAQSASDRVALRLVVDEHSAELFAEGGLVRLTEQFFPLRPFTQARLVSAAPGLVLLSGAVHGF